MNTQKEQVKNYLKAKGKMTSWDAITFFRITRLSHYILTLRKEGWNIDSVWKSNATKRWTEYVYKDFVSWK